MTGAGDLYAAGFLYGLTKGEPLPVCGSLGSLAAAEVIGHIGARPEISLRKLAKERGLDCIEGSFPACGFSATQSQNRLAAHRDNAFARAFAVILARQFDLMRGLLCVWQFVYWR